MRFARSSNRRQSPRLCILLLSASLASSALPAAGVTRTWNNPAGGQAATATNWTPSGVPDVFDDLRFSLHSTYTVTYTDAVPIVSRHSYFAGNVSLSIASSHTVTAVTLFGPSIVSLIDGILRAENQGIVVGDASGDACTLNVKNATTLLEVVNAEDAITLGNAGSAAGTINVTSGGTVQTPWLKAGSATSSTGHVTVSGFSASPFRRSNLNADGSIEIGLGGGSSLDVTNAGIVHCQSLQIGHFLGGAGIVTVAGSMGALPAHLSAEDLHVEIGVLSVQDGGAVDVANQSSVGSQYSGGATLEVREGGTLTTHGLAFSGPNAAWLFTGGVIRIDGGTLDPIGHQLTVDSSVGTPTLELTNGGYITIGNYQTDAVVVGNNGYGRIDLSEGSSLSSVVGNVVFGYVGSGFVNLDTGSSLAVSPGWTLTFGLGGRGTGVVGTDSQITAGILDLGAAPYAEGTLTVSGAGAALTVLDALHLGGYSSPGGTGTLTVADGGLVTVDETGTTTTIWDDGGVLNVNAGGTFTSTGNVDHRGEINLAGGTIQVPTLDFSGPASITGHGTVIARVLVDATQATLSASGGSLALGNPTDPQGFVSVGTLHVGGETVTLNDADGATLGNVQMGGGRLVLPAGGTLVAGETLSGSGRVDGGLTNGGAITLTGSGLQFDGMLTGVGQGITGTTLTLLDGGGFTGSGEIGARIDADAGSVITATGNLTMGLATSPTGVTLDGDLNVGSYAVTLQDADGVTLGSRTTLSGGNLTYSGALSLTTGRSLSGNGRTTASLLQNGGVVSPGASAGALTHIGAFTQLAGGTLEMELGDHASEEWDLIRIAGAATLAGTLSLKALPHFRANVGDTYRIMTFGSRSGTFASVNLQGFDPGVEIDVVYRNTNIDLVVTADAPAGVGDPVEAAGPAVLRFFAHPSSGGEAAFELHLPAEAHVRIAAFDVNGRSLGLLQDGPLPRGVHAFPFRRTAFGEPLPGGIYFGKLEVSDELPGSSRTKVMTARAVLLR